MSQGIHPSAPGLAVGITEEMIRSLVDAFYARIRADEVLGPIFNGKIEDWDAHLVKLSAFWSSVTLMTGRYKGTPMPVHAALPGIDRSHFLRWLAIFRDTADEHCPPAAAALFVDRAERIAQSLQMGIAIHRGELVPSPLRARAAAPPTDRPEGR